MLNKTIILQLIILSTFTFFVNESSAQWWNPLDDSYTTDIDTYIGEWKDKNTNKTTIKINSDGTGYMYPNKSFNYTGKFTWNEVIGEKDYGIKLSIKNDWEPINQSFPYIILMTSEDIKKNRGEDMAYLRNGELFTIDYDRWNNTLAFARLWEKG